MQGEVSAVAADYLRVDSLEAAIAALAKGPRTILAGGTDVFSPITGPAIDWCYLGYFGNCRAWHGCI